ARPERLPGDPHGGAGPHAGGGDRLQPGSPGGVGLPLRAVRVPGSGAQPAADRSGVSEGGGAGEDRPGRHRYRHGREPARRHGGAGGARRTRRRAGDLPIRLSDDQRAGGLRPGAAVEPLLLRTRLQRADAVPLRVCVRAVDEGPAAAPIPAFAPICLIPRVLRSWPNGQQGDGDVASIEGCRRLRPAPARGPGGRRGDVMVRNPKNMRALALRLIVGLALLGWAGVGSAQGTWSVVSLPQQSSEVVSPRALAVDTAGNLYVADTGRIQKRDAQGNWSVIATYGTGHCQVANVTGLATD